MPEFKTQQYVKLFQDSSKKAKQRIIIDTDEKWIILNHNGDELTMSLDNWYKILELFKRCETLIPQE
jgi:hypothetical protein